jgi:DNA-binding LacI/PurR family transcriptional regulator
MVSETKPKAPTILDVAAEAGVSKSAVSRALLGQGEVSQETRERVERAALKLGYVANALARGLVSSHTKVLGAVLRDVTRPFYAELQSAMQRQAESRGYQLVTVTSASDLEVADALTALRGLISLQVDGLVLASARLPSEDIVPYINRVPIVVAGRRETARGITSVFCDDADGGRQLAEYVLSLRHRKVAVVVVDKSYSLSQNTRGTAMVDALERGGITPAVWNVTNDGQAQQVVSAHLADGQVDAIMCPTDPAAVDVLEALRQAGLSAPEDVTVTGYDGFGPLAAPFLGLTTFRQPIEEIGMSSIDMLIDKIEGHALRDRLISLRGDLVTGRTAAPFAKVAG